MWASACLFVLVCSSVIKGEPAVDTPLGRIIGKVEASVNNVQLETFLGIPFAKPPVGDLRFTYPQPLESFGDVLDAKQFGATCPQFPIFPELTNATMSEDCLFLNIYRPSDTKRGDKVAVLVAIHGGAFAFGGTVDFSMNAGPMTALGNIIVVTISYRLGIFGFAEMGDAIPGNLGFYDQVMALEWIKKNIVYFGGDPDMVTVIGYSAGSMSVHSLIISPISRDKHLFQAAIMDAGGLGRGAGLPPKTGILRLNDIAKKVNCSTEGRAMVKCLKKVDEKTLTVLSYDPEYSPYLTFHPTFDGKFLMKDFEQDLQANSNKYLKVKMILGTSLNEASLWVRYDFLSNIDPGLKTKEDFLNWCQKISHGYKYPLNFNDQSLRQTVFETYMEQYNDSKLRAAAEFMADGTFVCPANAFVNSYSRHNTGIYVYQFERLLKANYGVDPKTFGVYHSSPFLHFMGAFLSLGDIVDPVDKKFFIESVKMTSDFVKTHNAPVFRGVHWPDYSKGEGLMVLDEVPFVRERHSHEENCRKVFSYCEKGLEEPRSERGEL